MSRSKTANAPDMNALLTPRNSLMLAVEHAILRGPRTAMPAAEQIAVRLAGVITLDLIHPGQRLLETDISEVLRVSRAPVREALRILERERLVTFEARRGAIVTEPSVADLRDIYVVRGAQHEILLRQVMNDRPADLEALLGRELPKLVAAEASADAYAVANFTLNLAINELSSNALIVDLLISIMLRTLRYVRLGFTSEPAAIGESLKAWRALKRAVEKRDVDLVLKAAQRRLEGSFAATARTIERRQPSGRAGAAARAPAAPAIA